MTGTRLNSEYLLQHFERLIEVPDAIPRLRRFILDLAVRGKLVEQDPNDEPAAELLKRIQIDKSRLERTGVIRKEEPLPPIDTKPYEIPMNWEWMRLGNTGRIFNGNSVSESAKADLSKVIEGYPFIATKDVGYGRDNLTYENGIRVSHEADGYKVAHAQSVLICAEGGSAGKKVGLTDRDICFGNKLLANETWYGIHPKYILSLYQSTSFYREFASRMTGIIGGIARSKFLLIPVPIPPLAEQQRIVAKVDELMALCDQLEVVKMKRETYRDRMVVASLHRMNPPAEDKEASTLEAQRENARFVFNHLPRLTTRQEHIKQLRQTILNLAVRGKLVKQDPNDEPTYTLLKRIRHEQSNSIELGVFKNKIPVSEQKERDYLFPVPTDWCWVKLADLITFGPQNGVSPKEIKDDCAPKSITLTATTSGVFNVAYYKHVELTEGDCDSYWLSHGDVLFQRGNTREYVGMAAIFDGPAKTFIFPDLMIRVRFTKFIELRFVHMLLVSPPLRHYFSSRATGASATMPKINQAVLLNTPFPLPPLAEQHRIVAKVDELMSLCDQLEVQITTTQTDSRRLLEAVLHNTLKSGSQVA